MERRHAIKISLLVLMALASIAGCVSSSGPQPHPGTIVEIYSRPSFFAVGNGIEISCESAIMIVRERKIIIHGLKQLGSCASDGNFWLCNCRFSAEGDLVIELSTAIEYFIFIDVEGNEHKTYKLKRKQK